MDLFNIKSNELVKRTASGIFIVSIVVSSLYLGGYPWFLFCSLVAMGSLAEFYQMIKGLFHVSRAIGFLVGATVLVLSFSHFYEAVLPLLVLCVFLVMIVEIIRKTITENSHGIYSLSGTIGGIVYCILPWSFVITLRQQPWGIFILGTLFLCTWSCDIMAYLIGCKWGKTPLAPLVSPKKTMEGFLGGLTGSLLCAGLLSYLWQLRPIPLLVIGLLCGTFGQMGDLAESLLKREAGIKDSGNIIPGHGGLLDRFDSVVISATLVYLFWGNLWS